MKLKSVKHCQKKKEKNKDKNKSKKKRIFDNINNFKSNTKKSRNENINKKN